MKMICIGRNYAKHAAELNNPIPDDPLIFMKPDTALLTPGKDFYYPEYIEDLHYECELVLKIKKEGKHINELFAKNYVAAIGLGIDLTARCIQTKAKAKGHPWVLAKGFDHSAPVSEFLSPDDLPEMTSLKFECAINGEVRQRGDAQMMLFSIPYLISYISKFITLKKGDLIFTGTPAGVGAVQVGDHITATLEGRAMLDFGIK